MVKIRKLGKLLAIAKQLSGEEKLHIEVKLQRETSILKIESTYIYEDGERILSDVDQQ